MPIDDDEEGSEEEEGVASTDAMLSQIGQQIAEAEGARHHVDFDKLGDHLDVLVDALSKLSTVPSPKQLQHDTGPDGGRPCSRCGLRFSTKTAYVPCFVEGDTRETWLARQSEEVHVLLAEEVTT